MPSLSKLTLLLLSLSTKILSTPIQAGEGIVAASAATAIGGALDRTFVAPKVDIATPPKYVTITVINSHGQPISTSHVHAASAPAAVSGNVGPGVMAAGATAAFAVPTGWAGNVAIVDAKSRMTGDTSLIEGSFVVPATGGYKVAVMDVDVSYVNGFSVAIVCKCSGVKVSGCNLDLWKLHTCPNDNGQGACANPLRPSTTVTAPTAFFQPCVGQAYTFPNDNAANSFGQCQSGQVVCCVGSSCSN